MQEIVPSLLLDEEARRNREVRLFVLCGEARDFPCSAIEHELDAVNAPFPRGRRSRHESLEGYERVSDVAEVIDAHGDDPLAKSRFTLWTFLDPLSKVREKAICIDRQRGNVWFDGIHESGARQEERAHRGPVRSSASVERECGVQGVESS